MSEKAARWIFWVGTLVSVGLLIVLTVNTQARFASLTHADKIDSHVVAGKHAFEDHNCNDCHTILGFGSYYAPDLTRAYARLGESTIKCRLESPEIAFADSFRKMPQQNLKAEEVSDMVAYLQWVSDIENHDWPPQDSSARWKRSTERLIASAAMSPGPALIEQSSCLTCHSLAERGGKMGPRLEWAGSRHSADWISNYIANPQAVDPISTMPAFNNLSRDDRLTIGEFVVAAATSAGR